MFLPCKICLTCSLFWTSSRTSLDVGAAPSIIVVTVDKSYLSTRGSLASLRTIGGGSVIIVLYKHRVILAEIFIP